MNYFESHGVMTEKYMRNNKRKEKNVCWDVNYDGNQADIMMNLSRNGKRKHLYAKLDNKDLAELLHFPVINGPLEERLICDFARPQMKRNCQHHHNNHYHHDKYRNNHSNNMSPSQSQTMYDYYLPSTSSSISSFSPSQLTKSRTHKSRTHKSRTHKSHKSKSKSKTQKSRSVSIPEKPETMRFRLNPISPNSIP